MLIQLTIKNFAVVKSLDIQLEQGLTAITGETGAGKSIAIDALGLCLGNRAEAGMVRPQADKADVSATFNTAKLENVKAWLKEQDLETEDDDTVIRRVISSEGRSKAYINGHAVPLQQLKILGNQLVSIHGQHAHHQLLKSDAQLAVLDNFAAHEKLQGKVKQAYTVWQQSEKEYKKLLEEKHARDDRKQLLSYQVQELDEFALQDGEFETLEVEHKRLTHSQTLLEQSQISLHKLYNAEQGNALSIVQESLEQLSELQEHDTALKPIVEMLNDASIQIEEASQELRHYTDHLDIDPLRMQQVEERYSQALDLARKHKVQPEQLAATHAVLAEEFHELQADEEQLEILKQQVTDNYEDYQNKAKQLSDSRTRAGKKLSKALLEQIQRMNMKEAKLEVSVSFDPSQTATAKGLDKVQFLVSTNPGQPLDSMEKVASGGELSRIGLAIQVIGSSNNNIPTLIFDEVDTGISGPTAAVVGQLLRQLGDSCQAMCVTHLPQVAACAHNQMFVTKFSDKQTTETHMISLSKTERIDELARLLAGDEITESAIANAKALLDQS
ncbi:DNA repair protein RecN [Alteromonadaceae bacterium M269]|nr:DNA repair protein RecN [Alteromonadaceae bacterium M269]